MKYNTKQINIFGNLIQIPLPEHEQAEAEKLLAAVKNGKDLTVEIKQKRKGRSVDANGYLWSLLGEMAAVLHTSKDELYLLMLERYGVFTHMIVKPNVVERVKQEWKAVKELGEVTVNRQTGIQLQCYFGSSTYNSKEFSVLLDGVISEAKELGIEHISEADKQILLNEWGKKSEVENGSN